VLNARYRTAGPAERPGLANEIVRGATKRHKLLAILIDQYPGEVMKLALPDSGRAGMPAEVQPYLEQRLEIEGEIEILPID
jgi:hypothetical protein